MKNSLFIILSFIVIIFTSNTYFAGNISFTPINNQVITSYYAADQAEFNLSYTYTLAFNCAGAYAELTIGNDRYYDDILDSHLGTSIPRTFHLASGTYTWTMTLHEAIGRSDYAITASQTNTFYVKYPLTIANNFGSGNITLEGSNVSSGSSIAPKLIGENVSIGAIDQSDGTYNRVWNTSGPNNSNWERTPFNGNPLPITGATSRNYNYNVQSNDNHATLIADLKKICNVTFQNTGNQITINGSNYSSSGTIQSVEGNPITVSTVNSYSVPGVDFVFSGWNKAGSYYYSPITVSDHSSFTARYIGTPNNSGKNFNYGPNFNQPIVINWTDVQDANASPYITYKIYRRVGDAGTPVLLSNVSPGVQTYTDYDYLRTTDVKKSRLFYDVREYYSVDGTYSPESWTLVYGDDYYKPKENKAALSLAEVIPTEYKLDNFPNPFNPTTVINYQLPYDGFVTIKVYDMLGRVIATLVNENKNAGYYKVNFDASRLTSGVYIYSIKANNFTLSKKMLLMK